MTNKTILIILATLSACGYVQPDPCADSSPLSPPGSGVQDDCDATGGQEPDPPPVPSPWIVTCPTSDHSVCFFGEAFQAEQVLLDITGGLVTREISTCPNLSGEFECNDAWDYADKLQDVHRSCVLCDLDDPSGDDPQLVGVKHGFGDAWPVCSVGDGTAYMPFTTSPGEGPWFERLACPGHTVTTCSPIHKRYPASQWTHAPSVSITCECPDHTDEECQVGAVCEAAFKHVGPGLWSQPTECTWDGQHGRSTVELPPTSPLPFPWAPDLVFVYGDTIELLPEVFLWLTRGEFEHFDASLAFGPNGDVIGFELEAFAAGSFPDYAGLEVGDVVVVDQGTSDTLARGEHAQVPVHTATGLRLLDVSVSL